MNWTHFLIALIGSGIVMSLTDWFFFGILFHDKYHAHPEVWRGKPGQPETRNIIIVTLLGFVTAAVFLIMYTHSHAHGFTHAFGFAFHIWLMVALPLIISNALYIKFHPLLVVSHSLGWLAKLTVVAIAAAWLLP
jgi:uncharacterized protein DUF1761